MAVSYGEIDLSGEGVSSLIRLTRNSELKFAVVVGFSRTDDGHNHSTITSRAPPSHERNTYAGLFLWLFL